MLRLALVAPLIAYLPGALLFRAPVARRSLRAAIATEERAFWAILLSVTWSVGVVMALAACGMYTFDRLLWTNGLVSAAALAMWRGRLRYRGEAAAVSPAVLLPIAIIVCSAWLYFPAADYVMGGKDPGTYINEGATIASRGTLAIDDADVASLPAQFRGLFFPPYVNVPYDSLRFMGFFVMDTERGSVMGQFPHWFPASIAIGEGVAGAAGRRNAIVAWALVGLFAVYVAGAQAFGRLAAFAGTSLLAINVVQVWFARYPNSELPMQAMLFASVLAFSRATGGSRVFFGAVAGALASLALLLRYDAILAIAALVFTARLIVVARERAGWTFGIVTCVVAAAGLWYLAVPMRPYSNWYLGFTVSEGWWLIPVGVAAAALFHLIARADKPAAFLSTAIPAVFSVTVVGLATYAYFFRVTHGRLAPPDADAFRTFAWYITTPGLLFATVATAWLARRTFWRAPALFVIVAVYSAFFFYKMRIVPDHFWAARRFIAITIPGVTLFLAAFAADIFSPARVARLVERWRAAAVPASAARAISVVLTLAAMAPLGFAFWRQTEPILAHVEYAGLSGHLESLLSRVGTNDLLVVESRRADSDLHVLALPLAYIYQRHVLVLDPVRPDKRQLEQFVEWASQRYDRVLFLGAGGTDLLTRRLSAVPIASERFQIPEYASVRNAYPVGVRHKEFDFGLYRLVPAGNRSTGPIDLSLGAFDDLNVVRFYAKEQHSRTGELFRWTKNGASVMLLGVAADARTVTVWMSNGGRPASAPPAIVTVAIEGRVLGTATLVDEIRPYTFAVPADVARKAAQEMDPIALSLNSSTWNPRDALGAPDARTLGVMVTRVEVK